MTSQLTRGECAELCDFIHAWAADNSVELREARQWVDPETGEVLQARERKEAGLACAFDALPAVAFEAGGAE